MHPYTTQTYVQAFSYWGRALYVPEWKTSVLVREIEFGLEDAFGTYPITILSNEIDLVGGLERLRSHQLVSVMLILDDFHRPSLKELNKNFTIVRPFKTHYIYRPKIGNFSYDKHHRYEIRQALKKVTVTSLDLSKNLESWTKLYSNLIAHRGIKGLQAFPYSYHHALSELNGITAVGAWYVDELVSCHIWAVDGDHVHSHLAASSEQGYFCRAAYAVYDASLQYFQDAKVINIGGGAGYEDDSRSGLVRFKRGFSNDTALSYLCGAVLDDVIYTRLVEAKENNENTSFFPAYRAP